ncbi:MAG: ferritin-like domain-containing protein, partial [Acidimicrobiales bacterium]
MTADPAFDVQLLQTGASVENVLVSAYEALLGQPLFSGTTANATLRGWAASFRDQHADHARACNEIATRLGGRPQTAQNSVLAQVLTRARPNIADPVAGFDLVIELESASSQTYQNAVGLIGDLNARRLAASIMCVEAQHAAALYLARGLAAARTLDLIAMEAGA